MKRDRTNRVGDALQRAIAEIIARDVHDPRIPMMLSVVEVRMSQDLAVATVYLSVMGDEEVKKDCREAIKSAAGFIKREAMKRVSLRVAPDIRYVFDDSIEKGMQLMDLIDKTVRGDNAK